MSKPPQNDPPVNENFSASQKKVAIRNQRFEGTCLVPLLLKRKGEPDAFFYAPACARCGKAIFDFAGANVSTVDWDYSKPVKLASFDDAQFFTLECSAFVFHKECDRSEHKPWVPADCVFNSDQRRSFEKELGQ